MSVLPHYHLHRTTAHTLTPRILTSSSPLNMFASSLTLNNFTLPSLPESYLTVFFFTCIRIYLSHYTYVLPLSLLHNTTSRVVNCFLWTFWQYENQTVHPATAMEPLTNSSPLHADIFTLNKYA